MKIILKPSSLLLLMNLLLMSSVEAVPLHSGTTEFFVTEEVRVKRQAGYVYNRPSVSLNLPSRAPSEAPTESTQAPTVDRTQAQMMYYAYPAPQPTVNNSGGTNAGTIVDGYSSDSRAGNEAASGGASSAGYNYKQQDRAPAGGQPASFTESSQANAGIGQFAGSGASGYAYKTPTTGTNSISSGPQLTTGFVSSQAAVTSGAGYAYGTPAPAPVTPNVDVSTNAPQYLPPAGRASISSGTSSITSGGIGGGYSSSSQTASDSGYSRGSPARSGGYSSGSQAGAEGGYSSGSTAGSGVGYTDGSSGGTGGNYQSGSPAGAEGSNSDSSSGVTGGGYTSGSPPRPREESSGGSSDGAEGGYSSGSPARSEGAFSSGGSLGGSITRTSDSSATSVLSDKYLPALSPPNLSPNSVNVLSSNAGQTESSPISIPNSAYIPPNRSSAPSVTVGQPTGSGPISSAPNFSYIPPNISTPPLLNSLPVPSVNTGQQIESGPITSAPSSAYIPPNLLPLPSPNPTSVPAVNVGQQTGSGPIPSIPNSAYIPPNRSPSAPNPTPRPFAPAKPSSDYLPPNVGGTQTQGSISTPASMYLPPVF